MKAFNCTRDDAKLLYRIVESNQDHLYYIYTQSVAFPQWDQIEQYGYHCIETKDISLLLQKFRTNMILRYSMFVFPSKKIKKGNKNSQRVFLTNEGERLEWMHRQAQKNGFILLETHEASNQQLFCKKKNNESFSLHGVTYEGVLQINNLELFKHGFLNGIGSEKAYGFGMMMLSKV